MRGAALASPEAEDPKENQEIGSVKFTSLGKIFAEQQLVKHNDQDHVTLAS